MEALMSNPVFIFCIGLMGMILHAFKKWTKDEVDLDGNHIFSAMWDYFIKKNLTHSVGALFAYIVIYFAAMQMGETGVFTMFISGYCSDSMVNKAIEERGG